MPLIYGEGCKSFLRLQEEVVKTTHDLTIFGRKSSNPTKREYRGILASTPHEFASSPEQRINNLRLQPKMLDPLQGEFSVTNRGVRITSRLLCAPSNPDVYILSLRYHGLNYDSANSQMGIYLRKFGADSFVRALPGSIHSIDPKIPYERAKERVIYIAKEVAANMCNSIHSIRRSAIQFHLHHDLRIEQVYPESLWDSQCNLLLVPEPDSFWGIVYISDLEGSRGITDVSKWTKRPSLAIFCSFIAQEPIGIIITAIARNDGLYYMIENAPNLKLEELCEELMREEGFELSQLNKHIRLRDGFVAELMERTTETAARFHIDIRCSSNCIIM
ncbi:hypothetical protein V8E51_011793 [Hyaloscypha variabilis]